MMEETEPAAPWMPAKSRPHLEKESVPRLRHLRDQHGNRAAMLLVLVKTDDK
jgi:hypothetical protein